MSKEKLSRLIGCSVMQNVNCLEHVVEHLCSLTVPQAVQLLGDIRDKYIEEVYRQKSCLRGSGMQHEIIVFNEDVVRKIDDFIEHITTKGLSVS